MNRPSTSKYLAVNDPGFEDKVRRMLEEEVDDPDEMDDVDSIVDDSDSDPDYVMCESEEQPRSSSSDDEAMLEDDEAESSNIINAVALDVPMPTYFLERMRKKEQGPPNAWTSKPPPRNVRTPARNIIRGG